MQMPNYAPIVKSYNAEEFLKYIDEETRKPGNEDKHYELIDGVIYMMASPNEIHYDLSEFIDGILKGYFTGKGCKVYHAPFDLYLFDKKKFMIFSPGKTEYSNVFIPDLMVVCDKSKRKPDGVYGAPDLIVEIISKSNAVNDYVRKLNAYITFGVNEYFIVDPIKKKITVYDNTAVEFSFYDYTFNDIVKSTVFEGLCIDFKRFAL